MQNEDKDLDDAVAAPTSAELGHGETPVEDEPAPQKDKSKDEKPVEVITDRTPHEFEISEKYFTEKDLVDKQPLKMPSHFTKDTFDAYRYIINMDIDINNPKIRRWIQAVEGGYKLNTVDEELASALETGDWKNYFDSAIGKIENKAKPMNDNTGKEINDLHAAKWRTLAHISSGIIPPVKLWHSGFSVKINPPTDEEVLELYRLLHADKISLGRFTHGAVYSNTSAFTTRRYMEFIIDHIEVSTVRIDNSSDITLMDLIVPQDVPLLEAGMLWAMNPDGHPFERGCSHNPKECHHVVSGMLNIEMLYYFNSADMEAWQIEQMTKSISNSLTVDAVQRYQERMVKNEVSKTITSESGESIEFRLNTPSLREHISAGERWLADIAKDIEDSLGEEPTDDKRNKFITENALASYLRQYSHWCSYIEMGAQGWTDKKDMIASMLGWISSNQAYVTGFTDAVREYIAQQTKAVIGIPNYICPSCNKPQIEDGTEWKLAKHVLPIDVTRMFFQILGLRVGSIMSRKGSQSGTKDSE